MSLLASTAITVAVGGAAAGGAIALIKLAEKDVLVTYIEPGDGKMILRGKEFHDFHISLPGYHLNRPGADYYTDKAPAWEILPNGGRDEREFDHRSAPMRYFGFYPVGIPGLRSVNEEVFEWKEESGGRIVPRSEFTRKFKVNAFPYVIEQREVISKDGLPMRLTYIVGLKIINPHKALILTEDWLVQVEATIQQAVRNWASGFNFMQLISQTDGASDEELKKEDFERMVRVHDEETRNRFGVAIESAELKAPMPDGPEAQAFLDSIGAPFKAEQEARVAEIAFRNDALRTVTLAEAEATATERTGAATAKANKLVGLADAKVEAAKAEAAVAGELKRYEAAEKQPTGAGIVVGGDALKGATVYAAPTWTSDLVEKVGAALGSKTAP